MQREEQGSSTTARAGKTRATARRRHARPTRTRALARTVSKLALATVTVCVTGIVSVLLGAIIGVQGSPASSPPPRPAVVEEQPAPLPTATPAQDPPGTKPAPVKRITLRYGDTLSALAREHGTTVRALQRVNGLGTSTLIYAGSTLRLTPSAGKIAVPATRKTAPHAPKDNTTAGPREHSGKAPAPGTGQGAKAVAYAKEQLGKPYSWGGVGPRGFDCSGLVMRAWQKAGVTLPRTTWQQTGAGRAATRSTLIPGDLVLSNGGGHVALYLGKGKVIHAPRPGTTVTIAPLPPQSQITAYRHVTTG